MSVSKEDVAPFLDNPDKLEAWIERSLKVEIDDLSMAQLRVRATRLKIPFYTQYNKHNLILKIIEVQRARKAQDDVASMSSEGGITNVDSAAGCERGIFNATSQ